MMVGRGDGAFHQTGKPIPFFLWMSQCFQLPKRDKHSNNKQNKQEQTRTTPKTKKNMKDNKKYTSKTLSLPLRFPFFLFEAFPNMLTRPVTRA